MVKAKKSVAEVRVQPLTAKGAANGEGKAFDLPAASTSRAIRTTIVLSVETDLNLDLCRLKLGTTRNELITRAIHKLLIEEGFDPHRSPKNLGISY